MSNYHCPLCAYADSADYFQDKRRNYYQCHRCQLVFVAREQLPEPAKEKGIYDLHQNHLHDKGYQGFLSRLATPIIQHLAKGSKGIDFGCGPSPLLVQMLKQAGLQMDYYDPFYYAQLPAAENQYDFICCSEAIEHFHQPRKEWQLWLDMLKPTGWLCIMTKRVLSRERFANWHYKNDLTHVSFFSEATFSWLAERDGFRLLLVENDVVLMQKLKEK